MDNTKMLEEYDELNKEGLVDKIVESVPKSERNEFDKIVSMIYEDLITNNYEGHAFIGNQINKIVSVVKTLAGLITPEVLIYIIENLGNIDRDSIVSILKELK